MISKMWLFGTSFFVGIIAFGCSQVWAQDSSRDWFSCIPRRGISIWEHRGLCTDSSGRRCRYHKQ